MCKLEKVITLAEIEFTSLKIKLKRRGGRKKLKLINKMKFH